MAQSVDFETQLQRAKQALAERRFDEAISIYKDLIKTVPDNPGLLLNLGIAEQMAGQDRKAIAHFEAALKPDPNLMPAQLLLGISHLRLGEPGKATVPLAKVLAADPGDKQARKFFADALLALGRFDQAAEQFEQLAKVAPKDPKPWYGLERSYESLSRMAFAELEKTAPGSAYRLALAAGARMSQQQYTSAFYLYREAMKYSPKIRGLHLAVAEIYRRTGHPDWAVKEEEQERRIPAPDCAVEKLECDFQHDRYREVAIATTAATAPESLYWRSLAYNEMALQALSRLAELPPSAELHQLTALAHRNQQRHVEAVKEWQEALKLAPGDAAIERELAVSLYSARDFEAAKKLLRDLIGRIDGAELNYLMGDSLLETQDAAASVPFLKKAVEEEPGLLPARASLGRALLQTGAPLQAIPHLQAALALDRNGAQWYQLARAYQGAGQAEQAAEAMRQYQAILQSSADEKQKPEPEITSPD